MTDVEREMEWLLYLKDSKGFLLGIDVSEGEPKLYYSSKRPTAEMLESAKKQLSGIVGLATETVRAKQLVLELENAILARTAFGMNTPGVDPIQLH